MELPFIYGAQYYRAPTPESSLWAEDLRRMADCGFNAVKFFAQWRWVHRRPGVFVFDDMDALMDLAAENKLSVTLNVLFDVAPAWVLNAFPDCLMTTASGERLQPRASCSRPIGGYPGPCLNHPAAREVRGEFLRTLVEHYLDHPAMGMWDVWNEPESCDLLREPRAGTLLCYCHNCRREFLSWLQRRYTDLDRLNDVWGRCYLDWNEIEMPLDPRPFSDMIDWRLFNCDSLSAEAQRRIAITRAIDVRHPVYLHPVPNTLDHLNSVTGPDDFQITKGCDCVGGTVNGFISALQCVSVAEDRVAYNVESHLRYGSTGMYPRHLGLTDIAYEFLPQIGLGIRGFLYWQYRAEVVGAEGPAWGLLDVDGRPGLSHASAAEFWRRLMPFADRLASCVREPAEVAVFRSASNEIFHWCLHGDFNELRAGLHAYARLLYGKNCRLVYVDENALVEGLPSGIRLLVMPNAYALSQPAADGLAEWVREGGTVVCEAHTGGFDLTRGRHCRDLPGLGLAEAFGLYERNATAVPHLGISHADGPMGGCSADLSKAIDALGLQGGNVLPLVTDEGDSMPGWSRYAEIEGDGLERIASLPQRQPCTARKRVGRGAVYYLGTLAGRMWAELGSPGLSDLIDKALRTADLQLAVERWPGLPAGVRMDSLQSEAGRALVLTNHSGNRVDFELASYERTQGVFTGQLLRGDGSGGRIALDARQADLFVPSEWVT